MYSITFITRELDERDILVSSTQSILDSFSLKNVLYE